MGKHSVSFWIRVGIVFAFIVSSLPAQAQGGGPLFAILGKIDGRSSPPDAHAYVSVVDPTTGRALEGLAADNFAVQISEEDMLVSDVQPATSGVAIVVVIDRGGIGRNVRREQVVDLTDALLNRLTLDGSTNADMMGLIGIRGREEERETGRDLVPKVPFTDFDPNLIRNEFDALRTEVVQEVTPLYDGLDEAVEWLTKSASADVRAKLEQEWTLTDSAHRTGGPARYVEVAETGRRIGFITPLTHNFCESCNRVRLTCTGQLFQCLGQETEFDLRKALRDNPGDDAPVRDAIRHAISHKPKGHDFDYSRQKVGGKMTRHMSHTGG